MGFKAAMVLRGDKLSPKVTCTLPKTGCRVAEVRPLDGSAEAKHTADVLNEFVKLTIEKLNTHSQKVTARSAGFVKAIDCLKVGLLGVAAGRGPEHPRLED